MLKYIFIALIAEKRAYNSERRLDKITSSLYKKRKSVEQLEAEINSLENKQYHGQMEQKTQLLKETRILTDKDWEEYTKLFYELHPVLRKSLEGIHNLSTGDKRQLIFIKLGLKRQEIAHLMGISPEGAEKARQSLSKKIGLVNLANLKYLQKVCSPLVNRCLTQVSTVQTLSGLSVHA